MQEHKQCYYSNSLATVPVFTSSHEHAYYTYVIN